MELFGGQRRETVRQIEAHLMAEYGERAGAGAVHLLGTGIEHALHKVEILDAWPIDSAAPAGRQADQVAGAAETIFTAPAVTRPYSAATSSRSSGRPTRIIGRCRAAEHRHAFFGQHHPDQRLDRSAALLCRRQC